MEAEEVKKIVEEEIEDRDSFEWPEQWSERISECLVDPFEGNFYLPETQLYEDFWVVADLQPGNHTEGYVVVYDAATDLFGLAEKAELYEEGSGVLKGLYGTFVSTLENLD